MHKDINKISPRPINYEVLELKWIVPEAMPTVRVIFGISLVSDLDSKIYQPLYLG